jgi:hypothetical protein
MKLYNIALVLGLSGLGLVQYGNTNSVDALTALTPILTYDLTGQAGNQASNAPTTTVTGLTGNNLTRGAGLTATGAINSINSTGWNDLGTNDFYSLGFNVQSGYTATIANLLVGTQSSGTGPGSVNVSYSLNGGTETFLQSLSQASGGNLVTSTIALNSIGVINNSLSIFFRAANTTAANGTTVASGGTLRITNFSGSTTPVTIQGNVTASATSVPFEFSPMLGLGFLGGAWLVTKSLKKKHTV